MIGASRYLDLAMRGFGAATGSASFALAFSISAAEAAARLAIAAADMSSGIFGMDLSKGSGHILRHQESLRQHAPRKKRFHFMGSGVS